MKTTHTSLVSFLVCTLAFLKSTSCLISTHSIYNMRFGCHLLYTSLTIVLKSYYVFLLITGYLTIFTFHNPYGKVLRICQCLLLPCRQGLGLGAELVRQVYQMAGRRKGVTEVTVEDPCPAFCVLRDNVDLAWAEECGHDDIKLLTQDQKEVMREMRDVSNMCNEVVDQICKKKTREGRLGLLLRDEGKKVDRAEVYPLLIQAVQSHPDFASFRVAVKKMMYKHDADGSLHVMSAAERKAKLEQLFVERLERYRRMMKTAQRLGLLKLPNHVV